MSSSIKLRRYTVFALGLILQCHVFLLRYCNASVSTLPYFGESERIQLRLARNGFFVGWLLILLVNCHHRQHIDLLRQITYDRMKRLLRDSENF